MQSDFNSIELVKFKIRQTKRICHKNESAKIRKKVLFSYYLGFNCLRTGFRLIIFLKVRKYKPPSRTNTLDTIEVSKKQSVEVYF